MSGGKGGGGVGRGCCMDGREIFGKGRARVRVRLDYLQRLWGWRDCYGRLRYDMAYAFRFNFYCQRTAYMAILGTL